MEADHKTYLIAFVIFVVIIILVVSSIYILAKRGNKKKDKVDNIIRLIDINYDRL